MNLEYDLAYLSHDPPAQIKNWGGNFATHVNRGTNCAKLNVQLAPHNKLQKDSNRTRNEHKMQIAFTITILTHDKHQVNVGDTKLQLIK